MFKKYKNQKGITFTFIGLILIVLLLIAGMAIDLAFMYLVKNETQVAADAGALAGAGLLVENGDVIQQPARDAAYNFCRLNQVAGEAMTIASDSSNILSNDNDITLGYFNYTTRQYTPNILPVNAIQVRTRRTENSPIGPVGVFLGKVGGWRRMSAASMAIAGRSPGPGAPIVLCINACFVSVPHTFHFDEAKSPSPEDTIGWTELSTTTKATEIGLNSLVSQMIRGEENMPNVCCQKIYTNNGVGAALTQVLPDQFAIEAAKTGGYWDILVPIVGQISPDCPSQTELKGCPPGDQPDEPYLVSKYARIRITAVNGPPDPGITISSIDCQSCPADTFLGDKAVLLK
jgi:hypothetical protein